MTLTQPIQLDLFLSDYGQSQAHIANLEAELKGEVVAVGGKHYQFTTPATPRPVKKAPVETVPWPKHMRFD